MQFKSIGGAIVSFSLVISFAEAAAPLPSVCNNLSDQFDRLDRNIAMNDAEGFADNSAPRATLRELRNLNSRTQQSMLLEIMKAHGCPLQTMVNGSVLYMLDATKCQTALIRGNSDAAECKMSDWIRMDKQAATK